MNSLILLAASACYLSDFAGSASVEDDEDDDMGGDDSDSGEPGEAVSAKPPKAKKKVKKVKKAAKKGGKADKKAGKADKKADASDKNRVRLKDLAKQAKITEAVARKKLRDADVPRGEGRWSWELGSKALKQARKALDLA